MSFMSVRIFSTRNFALCQASFKRNICTNVIRFNQNKPKKSPIKRWNEERENQFWTKFDRWFESFEKQTHIPSKERNRTTILYLISSCLLTVGAAYAAVPLYRIFCQQTGYGGTTQKGHDISKVTKMKPNKERVITVKFNADTAATMQWNFRPQQSEVKLFAGETALAFYTAKNPTPKPIDGISTYNVVPFEAGQVSTYKVQESAIFNFVPEKFTIFFKNVKFSVIF